MKLLEQTLETLRRPEWVDGLLRRARVVLPTLVLSCGSVWGVSHYHEFARVQQVQVQGAEQAGTTSIRHLADLRVGESMMLMDLDRSLAQVQAHPWVASVEIDRELPGTVSIHVREHQTALLLATHHGLYRVSPQGKVFVRARSTNIDLPVLTGLSPELLDTQGPLAARVVDDALELLVAVQSSASIDPEQLSELHFDPLLGFSLLMRNGSQIRIGYLSAEKATARLDAMAKHGLNLSDPVDVDLDMDGLAVATPLATPPSS